MMAKKTTAKDALRSKMADALSADPSARAFGGPKDTSTAPKRPHAGTQKAATGRGAADPVEPHPVEGLTASDSENVAVRLSLAWADKLRTVAQELPPDRRNMGEVVRDAIFTYLRALEQKRGPIQRTPKPAGRKPRPRMPSDDLL